MDDTITQTNGASGRFILRIEPGLHAALRAAAKSAGVSLNEYCAHTLALSCGSPDRSAVEAVRRSAGLFGEALVGVILFGSFARGRAKASSDVDLMIVVDDSVPIDRGLYRAWDEAPLSWGGHPIEPGFVHLPAPDARVSGLWAELAVDGVILFERGREISRHLVGIRERIAEGRLVRREVRGQSYWVEIEPDDRRAAA